MALRNAATAAAAGGGWASAVAAVNTAQRGRVEPGITAHNTVVITCERCFCWERATAGMNMRSAGIRPDSHTYNAVASACANRSEWRRATWILRQAGDFNIPANGAVVSTFGRSRHWEMALDVLCSVSRCRNEPDIILRNAGIGALATCWQWQAAFGLLASATEVTLRPDLVSHGVAMAACGEEPSTRQGSRWAFALNLLAAAHKVLLRPGIVALAAVANACGRGRHWVAVLELLMVMQQSIVGLDDIVHCTAVSACSELPGAWALSLALLGAVVGLGLRQSLDPRSCGSAMAACGRDLRWRVALRLLRRAEFGATRTGDRAVAVGQPTRAEEQLHWQPCLSTAVSACAEALQWELSIALLDLQRSRGGKVDCRVLATVASSQSKCGSWEDAVLWLRAGNADTDEALLVTTAGACARGSMWESALTLHKGVAVPEGMAHLVDAAPDRIQGPLATKDLVSYYTAMSALCHGGHWAGSLSLLEGVRHSRLLPDRALFQSCARACGRGGVGDGRWRSAVALLAGRRSFCDASCVDSAWWSPVAWACEAAGAQCLPPGTTLGQGGVASLCSCRVLVRACVGEHVADVHPAQPHVHAA